MKHRSRRVTPVVSRRGLTIIELALAIVALLVLLAVLAPVLGQGKILGATTTSQNNLRVLNEAMDCYAADWGDRQFTACPDDLGVVGGNCSAYGDEFGCYPPLIIGWSCVDPIGKWFFPVDCDFGLSGWCFNMPLTVPITFEGSQASSGVFRLPNMQPIHAYLSDRVHDPVFYAPLDAEVYVPAQPFFAVDCEYTGAPDLVPPSYVLSPAAMYHPDVLRAQSEGGFMHPNSFAEAYESPSLSQVAHPGLKTRLIEHHWIVDPPAPFNHNYEDPLGSFYDNDGQFPYLFNQGLDARPLAAFFDGSVRVLPTRRVFKDDAIVRMLTGGVDGLWSRDTPFGEIGYQGASTYDRFFVSHHVLTTGGAHGRDVLGDSTPGAGR